MLEYKRSTWILLINNLLFKKRINLKIYKHKLSSIPNFITLILLGEKFAKKSTLIREYSKAENCTRK